MNPVTLRFSNDLVNHVILLHCPEGNSFIASKDNTVENAPVLYTKLGQHFVHYYFKHHKENIRAFCSSISGDKKLSKLALCSRADNMIDINRHYDQSLEVFYNLCIKLALLGFTTFKKGMADAMFCVIEKINDLATEACSRGDLDEKFDNMYNFASDVLCYVFQWSGCSVDLHWDIPKLLLSPNSENYFNLYSSYFSNFLSKNGNTHLNRFSAVRSRIGRMTKEMFIFHIQDWCDVYYGQLGEMESQASLNNILDIIMNISLLTVYAVEEVYPCSIRFAHESLVKLAVSAEKNGMFTSDKRRKLRIRNLSEV